MNSKYVVVIFVSGAHVNECMQKNSTKICAERSVKRTI